MTKQFFFENTILNLAYGLIDLIKGFSPQGAVRRLAPAIAFTYTLGLYTGDIFHKVRHSMEDHLVL